METILRMINIPKKAPDCDMVEDLFPELKSQVLQALTSKTKFDRDEAKRIAVEIMGTIKDEMEKV